MILYECYLRIHFSEADHFCYFFVSEVICLTEIFLLILRTHKNNKLSYQKVDMFEFGTILCFIVLLILLLPTPILFFLFLLLFSKKVNKNKNKRNVDELNKSIGTLFWDKVQSKYEYWDKGHRFNPKYGHRDKGQWLNPGSTLGPPRVTPDPPRSKRVQKGSPHHSSLKGFKRFQGKI